jgi:hypothetical protein
MDKNFKLEDIPNDFFRPKILVELFDNEHLSDLYNYYILRKRVQEFEDNFADKFIDNKDLYLKYIEKFLTDRRLSTEEIKGDFLRCCDEKSFYFFFKTYGFVAFELFFISDSYVKRILKKLENDLKEEKEFLSENEYKEMILGELKNYLKENSKFL